jgi:hypothetical protein
VLIGAADRADDMVDADVVQSAQLREQDPDVLAVRAGVEGEQDRLLDLVVVAPDVVAVPAEYVELVLEVGPVEEVAGVRVLRDEPECLPLARRKGS